jgi:hypothetical protein
MRQEVGDEAEQREDLVLAELREIRERLDRIERIK